ncbi:MAG: DivIVA domain-containing protein [Mycobacterium sp.]|nr:DivIVA domain-containing protein [Mycobacterium sp.]
MTLAHSAGPVAGRLSPEAVRSASFPRRRRGYDEQEVMSFLDMLAGQIQAGNVERASMRAEVAQLREEIARLNEVRQQEAEQRAEPEGGTRIEISVHAVSLLSQAQQAADTAVAEAEQYSRDLVTAARTQYQEILQRAQEAASNAVQQLPVATPMQAEAVAAQGYSVPVQEIEYVRTFAQVAQVQLRSVLDALAKEVDRLGQLPQLDNRPTSLDLAQWQGGSVPNPRAGQ